MGCAAGWAAEQAKPASELPEKFIRITMNPERPRIPQSLDTSIIRFVPTDEKLAKVGVTVDLIGAIHIGDKAYFQKLDNSFKKYDALLYEMDIMRSQYAVNEDVVRTPQYGYADSDL